VIGITEVQCRASGPTGPAVAHLACHLVWRQESEAAGLRGQS